MNRAKKGGEKSWDREKSKPGPKKKTKAEFLEKIEEENFDQQWEAIVRTHTFTLSPLISLGFSYFRPLYKRMLKFNKENLTVILLLPWNSRENHFARCES